MNVITFLFKQFLVVYYDVGQVPEREALRYCELLLDIKFDDCNTYLLQCISSYITVKLIMLSVCIFYNLKVYITIGSQGRSSYQELRLSKSAKEPAPVLIK